MKRFLVILLTFITVISVFYVSAFADEKDDANSNLPNQPIITTGNDSSEDSSEDSSVDSTIDSTEDATVASEDASVESSEETSEDSLESDDNSAENSSDIELTFTTENMSTTLKHMGVGLLGVMIVLSLIAVVVIILNKTSGKKD